MVVYRYFISLFKDQNLSKKLKECASWLFGLLTVEATTTGLLCKALPVHMVEVCFEGLTAGEVIKNMGVVSTAKELVFDHHDLPFRYVGQVGVDLVY